VEAAFVLAVVAALAFAFTNGFHDAANAIATLVATRGASPGTAIALAAVFKRLGPLLLGAAVANPIATMTSGRGPGGAAAALDPWAWALPWDGFPPSWRPTSRSRATG
jgi:hypothetical protein